MTDVLVVEDEALVAMTLEAMLEDGGFRVVDTVASGAAAIAAAERLRPDVVLMDINLPGGIDGTQAAAVIKARVGVPIVFVTGQGDAATRQRAMALHPAGYVLKPFTERALLSAVSAAVGAAGRTPPPSPAPPSPGPRM